MFLLISKLHIFNVDSVIIITLLILISGKYNEYVENGERLKNSRITFGGLSRQKAGIGSGFHNYSREQPGEGAMERWSII